MCVSTVCVCACVCVRWVRGGIQQAPGADRHSLEL